MCLGCSDEVPSTMPPQTASRRHLNQARGLAVGTHYNNPLPSAGDSLHRSWRFLLADPPAQTHAGHWRLVPSIQRFGPEDQSEQSPTCHWRIVA